MGYTALQISEILFRADRTMYKIGSIAYNNMFAENDESLDYQRDIIYIYKKAVEWGDDYFVGTTKLDKIVERLASYLAIYDYGMLNPVYSGEATDVSLWLPYGLALDDLTDVIITNVQDKQYLRYDSSIGQWINVGVGAAVRSNQTFTATNGQVNFITTAPFEINLIDVYLNGVKLNTSSYTTFGNHTVILNDAAIAGDIIDIVAFDPVSAIVNPPSQTGNAGKFLRTDGSSLYWDTVVQDKNYVHDQQVASSSWVVTHNLGKFASVGIVDTVGDEVEGEVKHNSINQITITFSAPVSGKAYIN